MLGDGYHDIPQGKLAMVVTHLETTAPQSRGAVLPDGLTFVSIQPDLDAYRDLFRRIGQEWLWYGRLVLDDAALALIIDNPAVHIYTLIKDGNPEALLELDFRIDRECELAYFGLTSALIGSGAGSYLMDRAMELAFAADIDRFHVHTCSIDSPQALDFYIRSGFTPYKRQIEVDDDPRLIDVLPKRAGPRVPIIDR